MGLWIADNAPKGLEEVAKEVYNLLNDKNGYASANLQMNGWKAIGHGSTRQVFALGELVVKVQNRKPTRMRDYQDGNYSEFLTWLNTSKYGLSELFNPTWAYAEFQRPDHVGASSFVISDRVQTVGDLYNDERRGKTGPLRNAIVPLAGKYLYNWASGYKSESDIVWTPLEVSRYGGLTDDFDFSTNNAGWTEDDRPVFIDYGLGLDPVDGPSLGLDDAMEVYHS